MMCKIKVTGRYALQQRREKIDAAFQQVSMYTVVGIDISRKQTHYEHTLNPKNWDTKSVSLARRGAFAKWASISNASISKHSRNFFNKAVKW
jgi:hypothetical protein